MALARLVGCICAGTALATSPGRGQDPEAAAPAMPAVPLGVIPQPELPPPPAPEVLGETETAETGAVRATIRRAEEPSGERQVAAAAPDAASALRASALPPIEEILPEILAAAAAPSTETLARSAEDFAPLAHDGATSGPAITALRVRSYPDLMRAVILTSEPAAYVVHRDETEPKIRVEVIGARAEAFQSELNHLGDPRVSGIWLQSSRAEGTTFEFRLAAAETQVHDFSLEHPAAIVLDFIPANQERLTLPRGGPAAPDSHARLSSLPAEPGGSSAAQVAGAEHQSAHGAGGDVPPPAAGAPGGAGRSHPVTLEPDSLLYDGFPVDLLLVETEEGKALQALFLEGRWATALEEGLALLETQPYTEDLLSVLHMLAEARYQLGKTNPEDSREDQLNFFQQALRRTDGGRLAAFARWRIAQLMRETGRVGEAAPYLRQAAAGLEGAARQRAWMQLARTLAETERNEEALALVAAERKKPSAGADPIELAALEGEILERMGKYEEAWAIFEHANAIAPGWARTSVERAHLYGRVAERLGKLEIAREAYFYGVYTFGRHTTEKPGMYLAYADLLRRLAEQTRRYGDNAEADALDAEARDWYRHILMIAEPRETDSEVEAAAKKRLQENSGAELAAGGASYAIFHMNRGDVAEAMRNLRMAYQTTVMGSADANSILPAIHEILPAYMGEAYRRGQYYEALGAWQMFGSSLGPGPARNTCRGHVAGTITALRMDEKALELIDDLMGEDESSGIPTKDLLAVWRAQIMNRRGQGASVLGKIEAIAQVQTVTSVRSAAMKTLGEIYEAEGRKLEAAQAFNEYARIGDLTPDERGAAWLRAAELYLGEGLPAQTIDIGLEALRFEGLRRDRPETKAWAPTIEKKLRLALARAYMGRPDFRRAAVTFAACLERSDLSPDERGLAQFLLGESRRKLGDASGAREAYAAAGEDAAIPEIWRRASAEALAQLEWRTAAAAAEEPQPKETAAN